jgi:phage-related minor tail protein
MADLFSPDAAASAAEFDGAVDNLQRRTDALTASTANFSNAIARAFTGAVVGGKQLDDVLKNLALRLSNLAVSAALKPVTDNITSGLNSLFAGLFPTASVKMAGAMGAIKPFATGGVIGTPTYFPLTGGGAGLAGEAGPEAIVPLTRGPDGRLGVATNGSAMPSVTVHITTPDADSFRRSEAYVTGQIARAVARGQRSL